MSGKPEAAAVMEEKSTEELTERIEYLTKQLEEDVKKGGAGHREREKREIQEAIEEHQRRLRDLCQMDAENEDAKKEFSSTEAELGKRRKVAEEKLEREEEELQLQLRLQVQLQRRRRIRQEELEREKEKEVERKRRISGEWMEEAGSPQQHHQEQQHQHQEVNREPETGSSDNLVRSFCGGIFFYDIIYYLYW